MHIRRNSFLSFAQLIISRIPNIVVFIVLSRMNGTEAAGEFSLAITYTIILGAWWVGLDEWLIRTIARHQSADGSADSQTKTILGRYLIQRTYVSTWLCLGLVVILFCAQQLAIYPSSRSIYLMIFVFSVIPDAATNVIQSALIGHENFVHSFFVAFLQMLLKFAFLTIAILTSKQNYWIAVSWTMASVVHCVIVLLIFRTLWLSTGNKLVLVDLSSAKNQLVQDGLNQRLPYLVIGVAATLEYQVDVILLSALQPIAEVSYYSVATTIFSIATMPLQALRTVIFPLMSRMAVTEENTSTEISSSIHPLSNLHTLYFSALRWVILIVLPMIICTWGVVTWIVPWIFGTRMFPAVQVVQIITMALLFFALNIPQSRYLLANGYQQRVSYLISSSVLFNILMNFILIPRYGAFGAAISRNISTSTFLCISAFSVINSSTWRNWKKMKT